MSAAGITKPAQARPRHGRLFSGLRTAITCFAIVVTLPWLPEAARAQSASSTTSAIAQVLNQSEPGSGFFIRIGGTVYFITARHVLGTSIRDVNIKLPSGESVSVPFADQLPLGDIDAALIVIKQPPSSVVPLEAEDSDQTTGTTLRVLGYPISDNNIAVPLTERQGRYLGRPSVQLDQGYSLLYAATTQVGFSGGPIIDPAGKVVGMHGRSESRIDSNGVHQRTGNALGIPIKTILSKLGALKSTGEIGSIDMKAAKVLAGQKSMQSAYSMLSSDNLSNQILSEISRAEEGGLPKYCIEGTRAYYYMYYSSLPDLTKAQQSLTISGYNKDIPAAYYALASLVSKKMVNFDQAAKYEKLAAKAGGENIMSFTERRLKQEFLDFLKTCTSK
jgi:S1-C subfamily serine protease